MAKRTLRLYFLTAMFVLVVKDALAFCPSMCQCDDSLLEASCPSARLDSVPILLNPSLRSLNLAGNRIATLRQSVSFYGELRQLDLSQNALHSLGLYHLRPLGHLSVLNVSANVISSLEPQSFAGLASLTVLDLSANRLTRLTPGLFAELPSLAQLLLGGNRIQTVAPGAFDYLSRLTDLHLDDNNLGHVPSAALSALSANLESLHLAKNMIDSLDEGAFRPLVRLQVLRLNDNSLARIDPFAFDTLDSLELLDLSFNRLDGAELIESLRHCLSVRHLDLSGNAWRHLPAAFLSGLPKLQTLNISFNEYLGSVDAATFQPDGLPSLTNLVMTNNALWSHYPVGLLNDINEHLVRLDLSGNAFQTLDLMDVGEQQQLQLQLQQLQEAQASSSLLSGPQKAVPWAQLKYLNAAYNPLECNCSLLWLWNMFNNDSEQSTSPDPNMSSAATTTVINVTCNSPEPFGGQPLSNLKQSDLMCSSVLSSAPLIVLFVLFWLAIAVGLMAGIWLFWRRRSRNKEPDQLGVLSVKSPAPYHHHMHHQISSPMLLAKQPSVQLHHPRHQSGTTMMPGSPCSVGTYYHNPYPYQQQPQLYHQPQNHHQPLMARDEAYTYHSAGTVKRIPVTVV